MVPRPLIEVLRDLAKVNPNIGWEMFGGRKLTVKEAVTEFDHDRRRGRTPKDVDSPIWIWFEHGGQYYIAPIDGARLIEIEDIS